MGVGSNLLVRDGGVRGVVIRFGSPFRQVQVDGMRVTAGAGCIDAQVAKAAAKVITTKPSIPAACSAATARAMLFWSITAWVPVIMVAPSATAA